VLSAPPCDHARQGFEIVVVQFPARPQQIAGDKKVSVREHQTPQARHAPSLQAAELQNTSAPPRGQIMCNDSK
jgi:hypothetical protein